MVITTEQRTEVQRQLQRTDLTRRVRERLKIGKRRRWAMTWSELRAGAGGRSRP
jgi:hypothetical protein